MSERRPQPRLSKREVFGWAMFDFANSSYTTVIVTVAYSIYFMEAVAEGTDGPFLWGVANFVSQGIVLLTAPWIGAIADFSRTKKRLLLISYCGCVLATACLGWVAPGDVILGLTLFVISNVFYSSGENLVASFLPEIAPTESIGRVSGFGWALGYVGGLTCLIACYPLLAGGFGADNAPNLRISFVLVAVFFLLSGLPTFIFLKERGTATTLTEGERYAGIGFRRVAETLRNLRHFRQLFRFLVVFLIYNCGVLIVVTFAGIYAAREIGMEPDELTIFFIVVQISAAVGALACGFLQDAIGSKRTISITLVVWSGVCLAAYFTSTATAFYVVGNFAGLAMGSSMSAGRALVGRLSPLARTGEFFGFWGLAWKLSAALGPLVFGILQRFSGLREAILLTVGFFVAGLLGLFWVDEEEGRAAALAASGLVSTGDDRGPT
jgi:UMF1 family MFS transporter